jgi:hypothetical protein
MVLVIHSSIEQVPEIAAPVSYQFAILDFRFCMREDVVGVVLSSCKNPTYHYLASFPNSILALLKINDPG